MFAPVNSVPISLNLLLELLTEELSASESGSARTPPDEQPVFRVSASQSFGYARGSWPN